MTTREFFATLPDTAKHLIDTASIGVVLGTLAAALPQIAALFSIVWTAIRISETQTVRNLLKRFRK